MPDIDISIFTCILKMGGTAPASTWPAQCTVCGPSAPLLSIFSFVSVFYDWSLFSLFNAGRTLLQLTRHPPSAARNVCLLRTGQTSSFSAFASIPASYCAFSIHFLRSDGAFGSLSASFHVKKV
jgi:hypothetical protein